MVLLLTLLLPFRCILGVVGVVTVGEEEGSA